jgi:hypothetical protein
MRIVIKKRCTFMIEPEVLERLQSITARTGLSQSEQIRQGIRWWLESREWPVKADVQRASSSSDRTPAPARSRSRSGSKRR